MDSAQISIPDLDDDEIFNTLPQPPFASAGNTGAAGGSAGGGSGSDSVRTGSFDELRRPSRPWLTHGRSGSGTSGESSLGGGGGGEGSSVVGSRIQGPGGWSFPRKTSFASIKAAIKGGSSANHAGSGANGISSSNATFTAAYDLLNFGPSMSTAASSNAAFRPFNRTPSAGNTREAGSLLRKPNGGNSHHQRNDSQLSGQSRAHSVAPSMSQQVRGHHSQQASYFSEQSAGHASSSGSHNHGMPPLPPFPEHYATTSVPTYPPGFDMDGQHYASDETRAYYYSEDEERGQLVPQSDFCLTNNQNLGSTPNRAVTHDQQWVADSRAHQIGRMPPHLAMGPMTKESPSGAPSPSSLTGVLPPGIGSADPHSPSEFALNVLMSRFLSRTQLKLQTVLDHGLEAEPLLEPFFGPRTDEDFERLLISLAHVSRNSPKMVIESLVNWHTMHADTPIDAEAVRRAMSESVHYNGVSVGQGTGILNSVAGATTPGVGVKEAVAILSRRKTLFCTYILARSLIEVSKQLQLGSIAESDIEGLFSQLFELLQSCSRNRIPRSTMQSTAFDTVARLLGQLSHRYFMPIGDRFISMLEHCAKVPPSKNVELAQETAVEGMRHLSITIFPMEQFEEGAEILETVAQFFAGAHGQRVKSAYAETLTHLILPVAQSASAEINHPTWVKAMDLIAQRAASMAAKPRYWPIAYPLYVAALCASPETQFLQGIAGNSGWSACLEAAMPRIKDRNLRSIIMNAAIRLIWVYMFRCRESSNATAKRLEAFYRQWFPAIRPSVVVPAESSLYPHIYMVHLLLYRHFDFGRDLVYDFLRYNALSGNTLSLQPDIIISQRMIIGVRAILLTLDAYVKSESPPFPSSADFSRYDLSDGKIEESGDELPEGFTFPRPEIGDAQVKFNDLIGKISLICDHQVGSTSVFDESVTVLRTNNVPLNGTLIDHERCFVRTHSRGRLSIAYAREQQPYMDLHRACIECWPRCLSSSIPFASVLSCLFRAYWSADPALCEAASQALRRIARQRKGGGAAVVSGFGRHMFRAETVFWETHPHQSALLLKVEAAVKLWTEFLNTWLSQLRSSQNDETAENSMERTSAWAINDEVEAYGLLLLCSGHRHLRRQAISILRLASVLDEAFSKSKNKPLSSSGGMAAEPSRMIHLLDLPCRDFCNAEDAQLSTEQRSKVQEWTRSNSTHPLSDLSESDFPVEHSLWQHVLPRFLRLCLEHFPTTVAVFRLYVTNRVLNMDAAVAVAAGLVPRSTTTLHGGSTTKSLPTASSIPTTGLAPMPAGSGSATDQALMAEHWKFYILALCTTTTSTEGSRGALNAGGHRRQSSDSGSSERVIAARDLFQKLVPFLASDHEKFRDAVVTALGNVNVNLYRTLLETLQAVSSQLHESSGKGRSLGRGVVSNRRHVRLRTALGHVVQLTSSHMSFEETLSDGPVMTLILHWVTKTFNFLTERDVRGDWDFQQLRRFFCGVVQDLYQGLWPRGDYERYFPFETRLRIFKLFAEWYSYSQSAKDGPAKLAGLLADVAEQLRDDKQREHILSSLRGETQALSFHASDAMATLCQGSIVGPPTLDETIRTTDTPFEPSWLVKWTEGLLKSSAPTNHSVSKRALRSLIQHNGPHEGLIAAVIEGSFNEVDSVPADQSLFACFSETVTAPRERSLRIEAPLQNLFVLGLTKLGHRDVDIRRKAFALIDWAARNESPGLPLHDVEIGVSSPLPATYLRAQRDTSAFLAHHFGRHKVAFVSEATTRLSLIDPLRRSTTLGLLPDWLRDIDLLQGADSAGGGNELTYCSMFVLSNLLYLTVRYGDDHNFEIQDAWASLAEGSQIIFNANAIVKFLVEQGLCYRSSLFVIHAKRVVSCLSHTIIGPHMFDELCAFIEPASMIPVPRKRVAVQASASAHRNLFKCNLNELLPAPTKQQVFSPGQLALLFVCELMYERSKRLNSQLPLLLHGLFMQMDSFIPFVQEQAVAAFEQLMRSLASMSAAIVGTEGAAVAKTQVETLFTRSTPISWSPSDLEVSMDEFKTPRAMRLLVQETLRILQPLVPDLKDRWADLALYWATSGPVRHIACRSFQVFRIMLRPVTPKMLADMLGRLSNTVSDPNIDIQSFSLEILYTLTALIKSTDRTRQDIFIQIFWAAIACLNTINEREYAVGIDMLDGLLDKVDIGDPATVKVLCKKCPEGWEGEVGGIQPLVLRGLRSSLTSAASFKALMRLAKVTDATLLDSSNGRTAFLLVNAMPWFLNLADNTQGKDPAVLDLAQDIAVLCDAEGRSDISRVAASIAKSRFRTKDDLIRQAVNSIKANFLPDLGPQLAVNLLGLTLNQHEWLRSNAMQVLKIFFQVVDTRSERFSSLGPELLVPLLRLLSTPLAGQALDVLDEPITLFGGPTADQILHMSLQWGKPSRRRENANDASIFGAPDDSGWAVANPQNLTSRTRINTQAVFKTCELTLDVSPVSIVDFVNEDYYYASPSSAFLGNSGEMGSLGDIVSQLHDLSSFFADGDYTATVPQTRELDGPIDGQSSSFPVFGTSGLDESESYLPQASKMLTRSAAYGLAGDTSAPVGAAMTLAMGTVSNHASDHAFANVEPDNHRDRSQGLREASGLDADDSQDVFSEDEDEDEDKDEEDFGGDISSASPTSKGRLVGAPLDPSIGNAASSQVWAAAAAARAPPASASVGPSDMELGQQSGSDMVVRDDAKEAADSTLTTTASASPSGSRTPRRNEKAAHGGPGGGGGNNRRSFFYRKASTSSSLSSARGVTAPFSHRQAATRIDQPQQQEL